MQNRKNSVCVIGLWHLGSVTASCLASLEVETTAFDFNQNLINNFHDLILPIDEPGLLTFIKKGVESKNLKFTSDLEDIKNHKYYWITYDTPVDYNDQADVNYVLDNICNLNNYLPNDAIVLISSQVPIGTCEKIIKIFQDKYSKKLNIFCIPENLRLGKSIEIFLNPDRVVIGHDDDLKKSEVKYLMDKITNNQIWISNKSAEMAKHSINSFLATSVVFANEMASICEQVGANADEVSLALKSEQRIGKYAYLSAGGPFAGGTLARDVVFLNKISEEKEISTPLISSIIKSNKNHKEWALRLIKKDFKNQKKLNIIILGLSYKSGTNTLRRSHSLEIASFLTDLSEKIYLYDPKIHKVENKLPKNIFLKNQLFSLDDIDIIISTRFWGNQVEEIMNIIKTNKKSIFIYDINRNLFKNIKEFQKLNCAYRTIGFSP